MNITRLYTDTNGDSVFEDLTIALSDQGDIGKLSDGYPVRQLIFRETDGDYDYDFHHAPQRQFIIMLDGEIEIETSRLEKRRFRAGDILLAEDTTGKGHRTRSIDKKLRRSLFITLGESNVAFGKDHTTAYR